MRTTVWNSEKHRLFLFARNLATRYATIVLNALLGVVMLPYNLHHLGAGDYGLWMLTATLTTYFSVLELGYGGAVVKYVAEFRTRRDAHGLNEILSTMFFVFSGMGALVYLIAGVVALFLPYIFNLAPDQVQTGRIVLLVIAVNVALHFVFAIYGGVVNGFERYYINNIVATTFNVLAAVVNVVVLWLGYGLVELVVATTAVRLAPYWIYRSNAHSVFPELRIRRQYFNRNRLRELTAFSIYLAIIDWAGKLNFMTDTFLLGVFLNTTVVGIYAVAQRLAEALHKITYQLHTLLFPAVVHSAVKGSIEGQRRLLVTVTRFQLAVGIALCGSVAAVSDALIHAWVGPNFASAAGVLQLLATVVVLRAWMGIPGTILKGTGHHRYFATAMSVCAVANLLLSIAGVNLFGMLGVALGTLIPVAALASCFIFPRACRVVELPVARGYREIVWPALWPAVVVVTLLAATRYQLSGTLPVVLMDIACGVLLYLVIFFVLALPREERQWFSRAINQFAQLLAPRYGLQAGKSEA